MNKIKIANLKTLYELKKTKAVAERIAQARVFYFQNKLGLVDASCFLWPVFTALEDQTPQLKTGDVITFTSHFIYQEMEEESSKAVQNKKYNDFSLMFD